jgi:hypothetical protein
LPALAWRPAINVKAPEISRLGVFAVRRSRGLSAMLHSTRAVGGTERLTSFAGCSVSFRR